MARPPSGGAWDSSQENRARIGKSGSRFLDVYQNQCYNTYLPPRAEANGVAVVFCVYTVGGGTG